MAKIFTEYPLLDVLLELNSEADPEKALDWFARDLAMHFDFDMLVLEYRRFGLCLTPSYAKVYSYDKPEELPLKPTDTVCQQFEHNGKLGLWYSTNSCPEKRSVEMVSLAVDSVINLLEKKPEWLAWRDSVRSRPVGGLGRSLEFQELLNSLPGQVYRICRENYRLVYCSEQSVDTGLAKPEHVGLGVEEYLSDKYTHNVLNALERAFQGFTANIEIRQNQMWFLHTLIPYTMDDDNGVLELLGYAQNITERRITGRKLYLREQELSEVQKIAKIGNWSWSQSTEHLEWTESINKIFNLSVNEFPHTLEQFYKLFSDRSAKRLRKAHELILEKGGMYEEELNLRSHANRMVLANGKVLLDEFGQIAGISGVLRDITDIKNIQEHLRASERRLSAATKGAEIGIWEKKLSSSKLYLNTMSRQLLGVRSASSEVDIQYMLDNVLPQDIQSFRQYLMEQNEDTLNFVFRYQLNKEVRFYEIVASLYYARNSEKARYTGIILDVTRREESKMRIRKLNAQMQAMLDNSSSAIFIKRQTGEVEMVSRTGELWWGAESIGKKADEFMGDESALFTRRTDMQIIESGQSITYEQEMDLSIGKRTLVFTKFPIKYSDDEVYIGGIATDISQLKQSEQALIQAKEKAEESDRLKSAFLANMSHEIRTPLNSIIGFSDLLKRSQLKEEDKLRFLKIINDQGRHLLGIINDIIDLSAIEANRLKLQYTTLDLNELFDTIYDTYSERIALLDRKDVVLLREKAVEGKLLIYNDPGRLMQVLNNLVSNAIKFTEKGFVKFGYLLLDTTLQIYVKDSGIGMPQESLNWIFDRFRQVDQSDTRKHGGAGLGLSITKSLIEIMGGSISVDSELSYGTTFTCLIPVPELKRSAEKSAKETYSKTWPNKKVLIVEDDPNSAFLLQTLLEEMGITTHHCILGQDALTYCNSSTDLDLVLMDLQLPDISGYEATRQILSICPNLPIVAQTAQAMLSDREKAKEAGCCDFISKPINLKELRMVLSKIFN